MHYRKWMIAVCLIHSLLYTPFQIAQADFAPPTPAKMPPVEGYRVDHQKRTPFRVNPGMQTEVKQVLIGIRQMAGMRSFDLPDQYVLFRYPHPVTLPSSPVGHPIRELIITSPISSWEQPRLLVKNRQNQWVEYQTDRSLDRLTNQFKTRKKDSITRVKFRSH